MPVGGARPGPGGARPAVRVGASAGGSPAFVCSSGRPSTVIERRGRIETNVDADEHRLHFAEERGHVVARPGWQIPLRPPLVEGARLEQRSSRAGVAPERAFARSDVEERDWMGAQRMTLLEGRERFRPLRLLHELRATRELGARVSLVGSRGTSHADEP